jgi:1-pyrroline-5-carboxylate dehydrogenase
VLMELFQEAGVPAGVINLIYVDGPVAGDVIFNHRDFAGIHFTGSTKVFQTIWQTIGQNINKYKSYPRIVGETGGKDFIVAHPSAHAKAVATAISRGAFEYQGQKCSAASRVYLPSNLADEILGYVKQDLATMKMGDVEDFDVEIVAGGGYDKSKGYFVEPTVIVAKDPKYVTMCEELFGPVVTVHVYDANEFEATLELVDSTSPYALTGAIFSQDRYAIDLATKKLVNAAGNFYINDKPTGAVVGQQPFGGARASGTNDKAGSLLNLQRWVSPRAIKETFNPPTEYPYPFMGAPAKEDLNLDKGGF